MLMMILGVAIGIDPSERTLHVHSGADRSRAPYAATH